ncbi:acyl-CoA dehydrogenase family protein [Saccharothrix sp. NRRL B-16314]|uniref:acyl-CoA dehydrogenase family protein n=1 Tax=Saccharothrix sp. NRRL B-16314 TaxID=1463825 RepID=UPI0005275F73|nr:acyl-CoA dehydrogenase family protein [Saccharothrix sp. NRRL B-16314]
MTRHVVPEVPARVEALAERWRERAAAAERARTLPDATVAELADAGLLRLAAPTARGGPGHGWPTLAEAARVAARACPSTGWVLGVVGGHAALAGRLSAADLMFTARSPLFATASGGRLTAVPGGVVVSGRWRFSSAVDHASWVVVNGCAATDRLLVPLPVEQVRIEDGWHVTGMAATGSKTFAVDDVLVPRSRVDVLAECFSARWSPDTAPTDYLGQVPFLPYATSTVIGPLLGCAEGAFEAVRTPSDGVAESAAELACARHLYDSICDTLHSAGLERRPLTAVEAATVGRDRAYLARLCVRAVHRLVELSGTAAHFDDHPIARHWRDLQMMAAHRDVDWVTHARAHAALTLETGR